MKQYIERLHKNHLPENKGYKYVTSERVAIPIYRVSLSISKRRAINLELVEEMVLRLSSIGINNIDTVSLILGLPRDILDITISDLHVKSLAYHSSGKCILMAKGNEALKNLSISKREKDTLTDIYVDAITGKIDGEKKSDYSEGSIRDEEKMRHIVDGNDIDNYRRNMESIREIFEQYAKTYVDEHMKTQDELVSIDSIENINTGYLLLPIHIFVSENGFDIDVVSQSIRHKQTLEDHKKYIIDQLRERRLLPNLTSNVRIESPKSMEMEGLSCKDQWDLIKGLKLVDDDFDAQARAILFRPRTLFDNELLDFCELVFNDANTIDLKINDLNFWSKSSKFLTIGSFVKPNVQCSIIYQNSSPDISHLVRRIRKSCPNILAEQIRQGNHASWLQITVNKTIVIEVYAKTISVFADNRYIIKATACLQ